MQYTEYLQLQSYLNMDICLFAETIAVQSWRKWLILGSIGQIKLFTSHMHSLSNVFVGYEFV